MEHRFRKEPDCYHVRDFLRADRGSFLRRADRNGVRVPIVPHHQSCRAMAGMVFSASGLANLIAAPRLGKLSDRIGAQRVMLVSLVVAGLIFIPQAFVRNPWQLMALRFLLGLTMGGLVPSVNILIKKITPGFPCGQSSQLLRFVGTSGTSANSVKYITFNNVVFTHAYRSLFDSTGQFYELVTGSDWGICRKGAVFMQNAENITIENCLFDHVGGNGVFMSAYNRHNVVYNCDFEGTGANCVCLFGLRSSIRCPNQMA